ncbi:MAG: nucleotidyltransferase substrate binding protein [Candidatus Caenarcaniphilales bacterium]|nr:nucleotidyltransferase substrate binding protein [Candidatus Caenarcaniphilales bacterium]
MKLNFTSLEKAIAQLEKSLRFSKSKLAEDPEVFIEFRKASIQSFEFTYELAIKMLKRQLEQNASSSEEIDRLSFKDLIRTAAEKGLIDEPTKWFEYREMRNLTSHSYDEERAEDVYKRLYNFLNSTKFLLECLTKRNM